MRRTGVSVDGIEPETENVTASPEQKENPTPIPIPNIDPIPDQDDRNEDKNKNGEATTNSFLLPKRIISVIGLESSGTHFVTRLIANALGIDKTREGSFPYDDMRRDLDDIQVQHFSLPWGSVCQDHPAMTIQKVVLPSRCSRSFASDSPTSRRCEELAEDSNTQHRGGKAVYPGRYLLDVVSSIEWYKSHGVDQVFVIVMRDSTISKRARLIHCRDPGLLEREEQLSTEILNRAIQKYILGGDTDTTDTADTTDTDISSIDSPVHRVTRKLFASTTPLFQTGNNNVVLVSYESLIKLGPVYVKLLYKALGIKSDHMPVVKDGNSKYVID